MYKGKFDQKGKQNSADLEELLAQRNADEAKRAAAKAKAAQKKASSQEGKAAEKAPASGKAAFKAQKAPAPQKSAGTEKKKKGPRLGGVIFYTLYFMFILIFFVATYIGMQYLNSWLVDYEAAQPEAAAEQVFTQLFTDPDWEALYTASGAEDSPFEGKDAFVTYMNSNVDASQLTYTETSAGLSGGKKYVVSMGDTKVASFTLTNKNASSDTISNIPDWQLSAVEVFFEREGTYQIKLLDSHTAVVNGVTLDDSYTIQKATTKAMDYLPVGTTGATECVQEITGLMNVPTVEIYDEDGNAVDVTYDEDTQTFTEGSQSQTIGTDEKTAALGAAESYCKWMIEELTDRGTLAKYYDPTGDAYKLIVSFNSSNLWAQDNSGFEFKNETVSDYVRYSDTLFSCRVTLTLEVNVTLDGSLKTFDYAQSLFFSKSDSGSWLCFDSTNEDVSEPVGQVRLTFMQGDTMLTSDFYETDADQIITPLLTVPEGQVFSGWVRKDEDENGKTVLTLVFQPDSSGYVDIPDGVTLTPMTLYALFEDEGSAQVTAETTAATAETTTAATTEGA